MTKGLGELECHSEDNVRTYPDLLVRKETDQVLLRGMVSMVVHRE